LSASLAVLGLVIEEPDTPSRVGQRLTERFRSAQFAPSTAYMTLPRLEEQGLVRALAPVAAPDGSMRYEATDKGVERFRRWLRTSSGALPAIREALHARIDLSQPEDIDRVIEIIENEQKACSREYAAAHGRLIELRQSNRDQRDSAPEWSRLVREVVMTDEAMVWGSRASRLGRLRDCMDDLRQRLQQEEATRP
jgi:DNA-binding PadR family transcriptional regulator